MKKHVFFLFPFLMLMALVLSACAGAQGQVSPGGTGQASNELSVNVPSATSVSSSNAMPHEVEGVITAIDANSITIDGVVYDNIANLDALRGMLQVGDVVKVEFVTNPDNTVSALVTIKSSGTESSSSNNELIGVVDAIDATTITVDGVVYNLTDATKIESTIQVGDVVKLELITNPDGTVTVIEIKLVSQDSGSDSDDDSDDNSNNEIIGVVDAIDATTITVDGVVYNLTDATKIEGTIQVGDVVKLELITNPDGTVTVIEIKLASQDDSNDDSNDDSSDDSSDDSDDDSHDDSNHSSDDDSHDDNSNDNSDDD